ncbi:hypothetical protein RF55_20436 [Lasius niger]|uniref:Uncharacterized protein n=1 Tax=Lasius niger TaxID=67767 RepID=A0A0J7MS07_LASNI|nr:hypothetical protein RF55_20436 [Lasius niger]
MGEDMGGGEQEGGACERKESRGLRGEEGKSSWWSCVDEEEKKKEVEEVWKRVKGRLEEKRRKEERDRERDPEEKREERIRRERWRRNLVWRGIEGDSFKERCEYLRVLMEKVLGRKAEIRGVEERIGEGGRRLLLVVMEKGEDRDEILGKRGRFGGDGRWRWTRI